jgi:hypothetical protein
MVVPIRYLIPARGENSLTLTICGERPEPRRFRGLTAIGVGPSMTVLLRIPVSLRELSWLYPSDAHHMQNRARAGAITGSRPCKFSIVPAATNRFYPTESARIVGIIRAGMPSRWKKKRNRGNEGSN